MLLQQAETRSVLGSNIEGAAQQSSQIDWLTEYPPPRSLPLDRQALRLFERAYYIGLQTEPPDGPPITFSTLLLALLTAPDDTSHWFADVAETCGPRAEDVRGNRSIDQEKLDAAPEGKPVGIRVSNDKQLLTISAAALLQTAESWAQRVKAFEIGVRHVVAAYVLNPPPVHRSQMLRWSFQEAKWRPLFFDWVASKYTVEGWMDASRRPAASKAIPEYDLRRIRADAIAFPANPDTQLVLERASRYHARRPDDRWLRLQTLFYALVDLARDNEDVRKEMLPIWDRISAIDSQYQQAREKYFSAPLPSTVQEPFAARFISPRVLNTLETARSLCVAREAEGKQQSLVSVMELAGAVVSRRVDEDAALAQLTLNPQELRLALVDYAEKKGDSPNVWREALGEDEIVRPGRPVELNSDDPEAVVRLDADWGSDTLSIKRDVEAFGALLASKTLEPPLSIGLFGPWGSGKTTFLKRLRQVVDRRAQEAVDSIKAGGSADFVANVVHVEFNAWHFAESALTSSLVETIFRELSRYMKDEPEKVGSEWTKTLMKQLESTRRQEAAAHALKEAADKSVRVAEKELVERQKEAAKKIGGLESTIQSLWMTVKKELPANSELKKSGVLEALGDTINSADALESQLIELRARPARLIADLGWPATLIFAVLVLAAPPLIGWLIANTLHTGVGGALLSSATTILSVVGLWARTATSAVSKVNRAIAQVTDEYNKKVAGDPAVTRARGEVEAALAARSTAAAGLLKAQEELARATANAANATIPAQMLHLVSARIEDEQYNKELTTLSLARSDLQVLSKLLHDQRTKVSGSNGELQPTPPSPARAVDRVILYVDDLDRCKPEDVVRVLQMVHMLLAFELFAVVVAVDASWVVEALRQSYPWLDQSEQVARRIEGTDKTYRARTYVTPQDYLEKIFQISFWLEPMNTARGSRYLGSLVSPQARESGPVYGVAVGDSGEKAAQPVVEKIGIAGIELDYMQALSAYLGPSPRRVKRLINSYRLIKARLADSELREFLTTTGEEDTLRSGPYQSVISLLVIGTGAPAAAPYILKEFAESAPNDGLSHIVEKLRDSSRPEWIIASQVIEMLIRAQNSNDACDLRSWAPRVSRFLLNSQVDSRSVPSPIGDIDPHTNGNGAGASVTAGNGNHDT